MVWFSGNKVWSSGNEAWLGDYSIEGMQFVLLDEEGGDVGLPMLLSGDGRVYKIWVWKLEGKFSLGLILLVFR